MIMEITYMIPHDFYIHYRMKTTHVSTSDTVEVSKFTQKDLVPAASLFW